MIIILRRQPSADDCDQTPNGCYVVQITARSTITPFSFSLHPHSPFNDSFRCISIFLFFHFFCHFFLSERRPFRRAITTSKSAPPFCSLLLPVTMCAGSRRCLKSISRLQDAKHSAVCELHVCQDFVGLQRESLCSCNGECTHAVIDTALHVPASRFQLLASCHPAVWMGRTYISKKTNRVRSLHPLKRFQLEKVNSSLRWIRPYRIINTLVS